MRTPFLRQSLLCGVLSLAECLSPSISYAQRSEVRKPHYCLRIFQEFKKKMEGLTVTSADYCDIQSNPPDPYSVTESEPLPVGFNFRIRITVKWKLPAISTPGSVYGPHNILIGFGTEGWAGDYFNQCNEMVEGTSTSEATVTLGGCPATGKIAIYMWLTQTRAGAYAKIESIELLEILAPGGGDSSCTTCSGTVIPGRASGSSGGAGPQPLSLANNNSVDLTLPFGKPSIGSTNDNQIGTFSIQKPAPTNSLFTPQSLQYAAVSPDVEIIREATNFMRIRQVKAAEGLADVITVSTNQYEVRIYTPSNVLSKLGGLWQTTNSPSITYTMQNADPGNTNACRLYVIVNQSGSNKTNEYCWKPADNGWTLTRTYGLIQDRMTCTLTNSGNLRIDTQDWGNTNTGAFTRSETRVYTNFPWGFVMVTNRVIPGSNELTSVYEWYSSTNDPGYKLPKKITDSGGNWSYFLYDSAGRLTNSLQSYLNQGFTTNTNLCRVTWLDYTLLSGSSDTGNETNRPRTTIDYVLGREISRGYLVLLNGEERQIECVTAGASWNDTNNLATTTKYYTNGSFNGLQLCMLAPDGTLALYEYYTNSSTRTNIVWQGQPNSTNTAVIAGTKTVTVLGSVGEVLSQTEYDVVSGIVLNQDTYSLFDEFSRAQRVTHLDGTYEDIDYGCCGPDSTTARDGVATSYSYDALGRTTEQTRNSITQSTSYDAQNRITGKSRIGTNSTTIIIATREFDLAGRVVAEANALGGVTTFSYSFNTNGQQVITITNSDGGTRIETYYADGQLAKLTGTSVRPARFDYGVEQDGSVWRQYSKEIKLDTNGNDTSEWVKTYTDMAGRAYKTVYAAASGTPITQRYYDSKGQLWKEEDADGVTTLYQYSGKGELEYSCVDTNRNGIIDFSGLDQITQTVSDVTTNYGTNLRRTRTYVWAAANSNTSNLVNTVEISTDGLRTWTSNYGLTNQSVTAYNPATKNRYVTNTAPDGAKSISVFLNDRLQSFTRKDSAGVQLSQVTYSYDAHGRQYRVTDARNGTTTYSYNNADQTASATTPAPGTGQSPQTTTTDFDLMVRAWRIVHPDGSSVTNEYYPTGQLKRSYGSRTYPVGYGYDPQGRMTKMTNWTSFATGAGARVTTWNYDGYRGFLTNKVYDGALPARVILTPPPGDCSPAHGRGALQPQIRTTRSGACLV